MRTSDATVDPQLHEEILSLLPELIAGIHSPQEAREFVNSFLSEKEIEVFSKRLAIVFWLKKGKSYKEIKDGIKVSSATVASVQDIINRPGIELAIKILEANEWALRMSERIRRIVGK